MTDDLIKGTPLQEVAEKGGAIYEKVRLQYEPRENGKFLAIEPNAEKLYFGTTSAEALDQARSENPGKLFYLVKIGFESVETLAHSIFSTV